MCIYIYIERERERDSYNYNYKYKRLHVAGTGMVRGVNSHALHAPDWGCLRVRSFVIPRSNKPRSFESNF